MSVAIISQESTEDRLSTAPVAMTARVLVAGVGNIFLRDDGFGPEVVRELATTATPEGVHIVDYGIRGMHLAYDLLDGVAALILVDAVPARRGGASASDGPCSDGPGSEKPGSVRVMRIRSEDLDVGSCANAAIDGSGDEEEAQRGAAGLDPHGMDPLAVLRQLRALGGELPVTYLVGCVPATTDEGIGLSDVVTAAIPEAIAAVRALVTPSASRPGRGPARR